uniref:Uncharacterized protein n=1 Tax=Chromera velia CCMP2878 TaxID=1169474 RepID=A0A0G4HRP9_9ALVE|eukprot:Cvel_8097.t1-p1 / transcript=Cvel_8097.t1 / gene=Cvel_8097 / organism=Chromera_velia_CCMP2878 / gene_product=hypothetical protein / transcript_product=hypothetical protein / location=Cvel_scaffold440:24174-37136(+) / protein_length=1264 / sequence_SO=supercontig / SO=protein_coding / is_pseudo=false
MEMTLYHNLRLQPLHQKQAGIPLSQTRIHVVETLSLPMLEDGYIFDEDLEGDLLEEHLKEFSLRELRSTLLFVCAVPKSVRGSGRAVLTRPPSEDARHEDVVTMKSVDVGGESHQWVSEPVCIDSGEVLQFRLQVASQTQPEEDENALSRDCVKVEKEFTAAKEWELEILGETRQVSVPSYSMVVVACRWGDPELLVSSFKRSDLDGRKAERRDEDALAIPPSQSKSTPYLESFHDNLGSGTLHSSSCLSRASSCEAQAGSGRSLSSQTAAMSPERRIAGTDFHCSFPGWDHTSPQSFRKSAWTDSADLEVPVESEDGAEGLTEESNEFFDTRGTASLRLTNREEAGSTPLFPPVSPQRTPPRPAHSLSAAEFHSFSTQRTSTEGEGGERGRSQGEAKKNSEASFDSPSNALQSGLGLDRTSDKEESLTINKKKSPKSNQGTPSAPPTHLMLCWDAGPHRLTPHSSPVRSHSPRSFDQTRPLRTPSTCAFNLPSLSSLNLGRGLSEDLREIGRYQTLFQQELQRIFPIQHDRTENFFPSACQIHQRREVDSLSRVCPLSPSSSPSHDQPTSGDQISFRPSTDSPVGAGGGEEIRHAERPLSHPFSAETAASGSPPLHGVCSTPSHHSREGRSVQRGMQPDRKLGGEVAKEETRLGAWEERKSRKVLVKPIKEASIKQQHRKAKEGNTVGDETQSDSLSGAFPLSSLRDLRCREQTVSNSMRPVSSCVSQGTDHRPSPSSFRKGSASPPPSEKSSHSVGAAPALFLPSPSDRGGCPLSTLGQAETEKEGTKEPHDSLRRDAFVETSFSPSSFSYSSAASSSSSRGIPFSASEGRLSFFSVASQNMEDREICADRHEGERGRGDIGRLRFCTGTKAGIHIVTDKDETEDAMNSGGRCEGMVGAESVSEVHTGSDSLVSASSESERLSFPVSRLQGGVDHQDFASTLSSTESLTWSEKGGGGRYLVRVSSESQALRMSPGSQQRGDVAGGKRAETDEIGGREGGKGPGLESSEKEKTKKTEMRTQTKKRRREIETLHSELSSLWRDASPFPSSSPFTLSNPPLPQHDPATFEVLPEPPKRLCSIQEVSSTHRLRKHSAAEAATSFSKVPAFVSSPFCHTKASPPHSLLHASETNALFDGGREKPVQRAEGRMGGKGRKLERGAGKEGGVKKTNVKKRLCVHGTRRYDCVPCGGKYVCEHRRLRRFCRDCSGPRKRPGKCVKPRAGRVCRRENGPIGEGEADSESMESESDCGEEEEEEEEEEKEEEH